MIGARAGRLTAAVIGWSLLLLSAAVATKVTADAPLKLRICYEENHQPPYSLGEGHVPIENPGLENELIDPAVRQAGLVPDFYRSSWKRCMDDLKSGTADALFSLIWNAEREVWAVFPRTVDDQVDTDRHLWTGVYRIYVRRGSRVRWDGKEFEGLTFGIGAPLGYLSYQRLQQLDALSALNVEYQAGLKLVANGRMDGYVMDQEIALRLIKLLGLEAELEPLPQPLLQHPWYLVFSTGFYRRHPAEAEQVWRALGEQRRDNGAALLEKYRQLP